MTAAPLLLPAVDIAAGRAAQVVGNGPDDPSAVARGWLTQGAEWLHLVDLDMAFGRGDNAGLLAGLVAALPVPVQLSGGVADEDRLQQCLATGAARVVLSSAALRDPDWVLARSAELGPRLAVGVDVADGQVVARGSDVRLGPLDDVLAPLVEAGCRVLLVADAGRDGTRRGADLDLFARVLAQVDPDRTAVIASGGVAGPEDLSRLCGLPGLAGVVLGSALYHGRVGLPEALRIAAAVGSQA